MCWQGWLNERVHKVGSFYPSGDLLMEQVTGAPLDPSIFLAYLKDKYTPLYKL
jgi:carboxypeptidase Taq